MLVSDAAKQLNMSTQTLRLALRQQLFDFGVAIKTSDNRYTYYINAKRLEKYLEGRDYEGNSKNHSDSNHYSHYEHYDTDTV